MKILESQRNHFFVWPNTIRRIKKFAQKSTMERFRRVLSRFRYTLCNEYLKCAHHGQTDAGRHIKLKEHVNNLKSIKMSSNIAEIKITTLRVENFYGSQNCQRVFLGKKTAHIINAALGWKKLLLLLKRYCSQIEGSTLQHILRWL